MTRTGRCWKYATNRHRYYDPLTAQYVSPDPAGLAGGYRPLGYVESATAQVVLLPPNDRTGSRGGTRRDELAG